MRVAVLLLAWNRPYGTLQNLKNLSDQTVEGFSVIVSNSNPRMHNKISGFINDFPDLDVTLRLDSNDQLAFRRIPISRQLAEEGYDVIMFIDDDVLIPNNYVELALEQYKPFSYSSAYAWKFFDGGSDYYKKRERVYSVDDPNIKYLGAGMSMFDSRLFLLDGVASVPEGAIAIEDLWLSYYADFIAGYKLTYLDIPGITLGGADSVALYRQVSKQKYTKKDLLLDLVATGWKV